MGAWSANPESQTAADKLIVALDFPSAAPALALVDRLEGRVRWYKVGLELYLADGQRVIDALVGRGLKVFLDLKLYDIPNTVAGAVRVAGGTGASLLTVHASGGPAMLDAAQQVAGAFPAMKLLGVTVLTSMDGGELDAVGVRGPVSDAVLRLGRLAIGLGLPGLVCSAAETGLLRDALGPAPLLVVPGIRSQGAALQDQKRAATPAPALAGGASMLVVGRPITLAADPVQAIDAILSEMG